MPSRASAKMPPALSDSEDNFDTVVASGVAKTRKNGAKSEADESDQDMLAVESDAEAEKEKEKDDDNEDDSEDDNKDDNEDDNEEEEDDEMFAVEEIMSHIFDEDGQLLFHIKWENYPNKKDFTWEPEKNLETAQELVDAYLESLGGREKVIDNKRGKKGTKRRRQSNISAPASTKKAYTTTTRKSASVEQEAVFQPPTGSWEDEVKAIDAAEGDQGEVQVYLTWKNGHKTQHALDIVYKRCPQKMLKFYENHLSFVSQKKPKSPGKANNTPASSRSRPRDIDVDDVNA